jgi:hypothetical protein
MFVGLTFLGEDCFALQWACGFIDFLSLYVFMQAHCHVCVVSKGQGRLSPPGSRHGRPREATTPGVSPSGQKSHRCGLWVTALCGLH